jgi:hypothetical protein
VEPQRRSIEQMNCEWDAVSGTPASRRALERLCGAEPELAVLGFRDLGDLVRALHRPLNPEQRLRAARMFAILLRAQSLDPLIPRALLQALVPGLVSVARRLSWGAGGDWESGGAFFADLLAIAWEVILAWAGEERDYAVMDVLSAVRCRARRQLLNAKARRNQMVLGLDQQDRLCNLAATSETDLEILAKSLGDLEENGLTAGEAAVLYGRRVLGYSVAELSRLTGRTRRHIEARSRSAERQLCA